MNPQDRLQPSLLDRLTDNEPGTTRESRDKRVLSLQQLRDAVKRDLAWLLNTGDMDTVQSLDAYPEVARSVLNFGMPDLTGRAVAGMDPVAVERVLRRVIRTYEPRILERTLKVKVIVEKERFAHNAVRFDLEGELWAEPVPLHLLLRSEIDLETGHVRVEESAGKGNR